MDLPLDPLRLAQLYEQAFGRSRLLDTLQAAVPEDLLELEPTYREIASIPWGAIVTTNYDAFLERAFEGTQLRLLRMVRDADLTRQRTLTDILLIKMHGEFAHRDLIVITEDDYNGYRRTRPGIATKVDQLLIEHPILFVGFSLDDPNVSRILNWVRATVGTLQLPSVSIVHGAPSRPESELWASRGIRLVHCPESLRLADVLAAFDRERGAPISKEPPADERAQDLARRLREAVGSVGAGWEITARDRLLALLEHAEGGHRQAVVKSLSEVHADDWAPVVESLTHQDLTRWMRLLSEADDPFFRHRKDPYGGQVAVILTGLLVFGDLSDEERTELAIRWTRQVADEANTPLLRSLLRSVRELREKDLPPALRVSLDIEIRELVFLLGDDDELRSELAVPMGEDPFALCRRAADLLQLGETGAARASYARARDRARTGDELYAAYRGLWSCDGWQGDAGREGERIPEVQRPRSEEVWKLRQTAGDQGLSKPAYSVAHLEQFVRAARALGWPPSAHLKHTGPLEGAARTIARIELEAGRPDSARTAVAWLLRLGSFDEESLSDDQFNTLVSRSENRAAVREWLDRTVAGTRRKQSHALFKIRCFDLLTDAEIDAAVQELIIEPLGKNDRPHVDHAALERWRLLAAEAQRMPVETTQRIVEVLPRILELPGFRASACLDVIQPWLWPLPVHQWRDRKEMRALVNALLRKCGAPGAFVAWPERKAVLGMVGRLTTAKLLTSTDQKSFRTTMDGFAKNPPDDEHLSSTFSALDLLLDLGAKKAPLASRFVGRLNAGFDAALNSSSLGQWCWAVRELGPSTSGKVFNELFEKLLRAASSSMANEAHHDRSPFFMAFAWEIALALGVLGGVAGGARRSRAMKAISALGERHPDALPALWKLGPISTSGVLVGAEDRIARAVYSSREGAERKAATQAVVAWCELGAEAQAGASDRMWELFIATVAINPPSSDRARRHLGWFADRGFIPERYRERAAELVLAGMAEDHSWDVRARSAIVVRRITQGTTHQEAALLRLRKLRSEPVALLRRAAERALSQSLQPRAQALRGRVARTRRTSGR